MSRRPGRGAVVLAGVALAVAVLGAASAPWLSADLSGRLAGTPVAAVPGSQAAPVVPAVALVGLAAAVALAIAGRLGRLLAGGVVLLAGLGVAGGAAGVMLAPVPAASAALAESTRGAGVPQDAVSVSAWPAVTVAAGLLLAGCGALAVVLGRRWDAPGRFDTEAARRPAGEPVSDWDALSRGVDPTADGPGAPRH